LLADPASPQPRPPRGPPRFNVPPPQIAGGHHQNIQFRQVFPGSPGFRESQPVPLLLDSSLTQQFQQLQQQQSQRPAPPAAVQPQLENQPEQQLQLIQQQNGNIISQPQNAYSPTNPGRLFPVATQPPQTTTFRSSPLLQLNPRANLTELDDFYPTRFYENLESSGEGLTTIEGITVTDTYGEYIETTTFTPAADTEDVIFPTSEPLSIVYPVDGDFDVTTTEGSITTIPESIVEDTDLPLDISDTIIEPFSHHYQEETVTATERSREEITEGSRHVIIASSEVTTISPIYAQDTTTSNSIFNTVPVTTRKQLAAFPDKSRLPLSLSLISQATWMN